MVCGNARTHFKISDDATKPQKLYKIIENSEFGIRNLCCKLQATGSITQLGACSLRLGEFRTPHSAFRIPNFFCGSVVLLCLCGVMQGFGIILDVIDEEGIDKLPFVYLGAIRWNYNKRICQSQGLHHRRTLLLSRANAKHPIRARLC